MVALVALALMAVRNRAPMVALAVEAGAEAPAGAPQATVAMAATVVAVVAPVRAFLEMAVAHLEQVALAVATAHKEVLARLAVLAEAA